MELKEHEWTASEQLFLNKLHVNKSIYTHGN